MKYWGKQLNWQATSATTFCFSVYIWCQMSHNQFSSVTQSCWTLCNPMDCSMPGLPVHCQLLELAQTHVHWICDAIKPSHPLSSSSPPAFNLSQHQGLFQWVSSSHQVAKVSELQLYHQSFQWTFRVDSDWLVSTFRLTGLISLLSKGLSRVFSSTTIWNHQFFGSWEYDKLKNNLVCALKTPF